MTKAMTQRGFVVALLVSLFLSAVAASAAMGQTDDQAMSIRARGSTGEELMQVRLGNSVIADFAVSTAWQEIEVSVPAEVPIEEFSVGFINNRHEPVDRNVFVDWVELDGQRRQGESSDVWSTGKWTSDTGCTNGPASSEALLCSGFLHFGGEPDGSVITVHATGSTGTENLELQIDGTSVATRRVTSVGNVWASQTETEPFVFTLPEPVDHDRIRVAFTNDGPFQGVDRNVLIDRIEVDTVIYETTDPRIESLGTWRNGAECGQGFFGNRTLACDGWFQLPSGVVAAPGPVDPVDLDGDVPAVDVPVIDAPALDVEVVAADLTNPWGIDFLPTGELLFTERLGRIGLLTADGAVRVDADFSNIGLGTSGLLGLAVDPDFAANRRIYTCQGQNSPARQQVVAWQLSADYSSATKVGNLVDIERSAVHSGCRLGFDIEGFLLATFGDDFVASAPQDPNSLHGKVLRIDPATGAGHPDNGSGHVELDGRIFTLGHRNPQGLAFHPVTGTAWISEHGPDIEDEINALSSGGNYGWDPVGPEGPTVYDELGRAMTDLSLPGVVPARWNSGEVTVAPGDIEFLTGEHWGELDGSLVMTTLKDQRLHIFNFDQDGRVVTQAIPAELDNSEFGRLRSAIRGPDGALYLTTSNSGFGNEDLRRDAILRVGPAGEGSIPSPNPDDAEPASTGDAREITVTARGTTGTERLRLEIDGLEVHSWIASTADAVESYTHPSPVSGSQIRVRFTNDGTHNGVDRNVWIDHVTAGDQRFDSEHPTVRSLGSWANGSRCREGTFNTEFLACNGWFQYADDGGVDQGSAGPPTTGDSPRTSVEFRALGSTGQEQVELQIDGETVETFALTSSMETYSHEHLGAEPESIRLEFVNDLFSPSVDRNVRVDFLRVDGEVMQTESSEVLSTGTWDSASGCSPGNKRSEWLHCAGYFEFGL